MRMTIELDPGRQPIRGWLQEAMGPRREFDGMLELLCLLEEMRERAALQTPRQLTNGDDGAPSQSPV